MLYIRENVESMIQVDLSRLSYQPNQYPDDPVSHAPVWSRAVCKFVAKADAAVTFKLPIIFGIITIH